MRAVRRDGRCECLAGAAERLADEAKKVDGIKGVKNLLHRPGTPAPAAEPRGAIGDS